MSREETLQKLSNLLAQKKSKAFYADKLGVSVTEVEELLKELRGGTVSVDYYSTVSANEASQNITYSYNLPIDEEVNHSEGTRRVTFESDRPLNTKEIEELAGVDNITTFVDRHWLKSHKNDTWTYSILVINKLKDFYDKEQLKAKFEELFPNITPYTIQSIPGTSNKALVILLADDHSGMTLEASLYGNEYSEQTYKGRLLKIAQEVKNLNQTFEEVFILRGGDNMDGWDGYTVSRTHKLDSLSNKEQFDIFVDSNRAFYDAIFTSNISGQYTILNVNNANHDGSGFAYVGNRALEIYVEARYPQVIVKHSDDLIDGVEYGIHVIGYSHGKDKKYMKSPMPLNLDVKTDLYLFEYFDNKGYSPSTRPITFYKADTHRYSVNIGKFGRWVALPQISSPSNWQEHNFGNGKSGALLEIFSKDENSIISQPIWF